MTDADLRTVRRATAAVAALALVLGVGSAVADALAPAPDRIGLMRACFAREQGRAPADVPARSPAAGAPGGALRVPIEGAIVTIAVAGSPQRAEELRQALLADATSEYAAVEVHADVVYAWFPEPTGEQRQAARDCTY